MKIHRFIIDQALANDHVTLTDPALVHQFGRVLRLEVGEPVILCNGQGIDAQGVIESIDKKTIVVRIETRQPNHAEPSRHVTLYLAAIKREYLEWAIQKTTELGISEIVPLVTARTIKSTVNRERLQTIAREAAEQSGRGRVPVIHEATAFKDVLLSKKQKEAAFFFEREAPLFEQARYAKPDARYALFIGPEGGWTPEEQTLAKEQGLTIVGLGPRTLRAETAAMIASYLLCV
jgi:16S rRNA (uracil1498-N3)-methyltransferase